jgi:hypothetical protein
MDPGSETQPTTSLSKCAASWSTLSFADLATDRRSRVVEENAR